jgi:hypothetical protein
MQRPAPAQRELTDLAQKLRREKSWAEQPPAIPPELYVTALDLMYSGHEMLGWQFINEAWSPENLHNEEFVNGMKSRLAASAYWESLK